MAVPFLVQTCGIMESHWDIGTRPVGAIGPVAMLKSEALIAVEQF